MTRYDPGAIEAEWQQWWLKEKIYEPDLKRAKRPFYNLMMFPYPSAEGLHVGNVYAFVGADIYGRFKRMQGYDVFEPIGLDGFGIHSENYALKIGTHPAEQANISEKKFYEQLQMIGNGFAWNERLETYDPEYYRWTQWIFVQMFKKGLAYRKKQAVNWCPSCKTVLADEQVISGACERCGSKVEKRELEQWFFKITDYAGRLLENLEKIDWSERIKIAQRNWIGRSEGALIEFPIQDSRFKIQVFTTRPDTLFGATYMVLGPEHTLLANSKLQIANRDEVDAYIRKARAKTDDERIAEGREKTGVELKGIKAVNPANSEGIPIWVADYVLGGVGTGAIMAVPAHDHRDFEFAKKFSLPVRQVIEPFYIQSAEPGKVVEGMPHDHRDTIIAVVKHWSEEKYLALKWKQVAWGTFITGGIEQGQTAEEAAKTEILEETGYRTPMLIADFGKVHGLFYHVPKRVNRFAHARVLLFKLADSSRQDVSGDEQEKHELLWLTSEELQKFLTPDTHQHALRYVLGAQGVYTGKGILTNSGGFSGQESDEAKKKITEFVGGQTKTQYRLRDWLISRQRYWGPPIPMVYCDSCASTGKGERPEMPGWYPVPEASLPVELPYIENFRPTGTEQSPLAAVESFYKTACPSCGGEARRETDVSDTFLDSAWYYIGYLAKENSKFEIQNSEFRSRAKRWFPVDMYIGGAEHAVLHLLYVRFLAMAFHDWGLVDFEEPFKKFRAHGLLIKDGAKMSKSRGNVVNPDEYVKAYGADALRMYLMFLGPFERGGDFRDTGIRGITRFLERTWRLLGNQESGTKNQESEPPGDLDRVLHRTIKKVTDDIEGLQYNTAISALMMLLNTFEANAASVERERVSIFLRLLAPFAPHLAEELWSRFFAGKKSRILDSRSESGHTRERYQSIHLAQWPEADPRRLFAETATVVIQVDGRMRDRIEVAADAVEAEVREAALARPRVRELIGGRPVAKFIYVPGRIANVVTESRPG